MTEVKWEEYRGYTFRLEKYNGEWWTFLRNPNGDPVLWSGLFVKDSESCREFHSITMNRVIKKVKRWIDYKLESQKTIERWP